MMYLKFFGSFYHFYSTQHQVTPLTLSSAVINGELHMAPSASDERTDNVALMGLWVPF